MSTTQEHDAHEWHDDPHAHPECELCTRELRHNYKSAAPLCLAYQVEGHAPAEWLLVNGSEQQPLCDLCFAEVVADMVRSNDPITFSHHDKSSSGLKVVSCD